MKEEYGVEILVPEMQKYLETGSVPYIDRKTMVSGLHPIDKCLAKANHMVFEEMFEWMNDVVGAVTAYSYLIVTGGTSAAWENKFRERCKARFPDVKVIFANQNDTTLSLIYSNVRGYYLYRFNKMGNGKKM